MKAEWFVVWVQTGKELELLTKICEIGGVDRALCPASRLWVKRKGVWRQEEQLLFPSYIFLRCRMDSAIYYTIKELPGVLGWLGRDALWPSTVRQEEMDVVLSLAEGLHPECVLQEIKRDRRQRRGYGVLTIQGKAYRVPYNIYTEETGINQAEELAGDASPEDVQSRS